MHAPGMDSPIGECVALPKGRFDWLDTYVL